MSDTNINNEWEYIISDSGKVMLLECFITDKKEILVPAYMDGYEVESIDSYAFNSLPVESVIIQENVRYVKAMAFDDCANLKSVRVGPDVELLTSESFAASCTAMKGVDVDPSNRVLISKDGVLFSKDMKALLYYPPDKDTVNYRIPGTVLTISDFAFYECKNLNSVYIPDSVTKISGKNFTPDHSTGSYKDFVIRCNRNSYADKWAAHHCLNVRYHSQLKKAIKESSDMDFDER